MPVIVYILLRSQGDTKKMQKTALFAHKKNLLVVLADKNQLTRIQSSVFGLG